LSAACRPSLSRLTNVRRDPSSANSRAISRPSPLEPPVMSTALSRNEYGDLRDSTPTAPAAARALAPPITHFVALFMASLPPLGSHFPYLETCGTRGAHRRAAGCG